MDHGRDPHDGQHRHHGRHRQQQIHAEAVVDIRQVTEGLGGVVLVRGTAAVIVVVVVQDLFVVFGKMLDENRFALAIAARDVRVVTFRGSDRLPRKYQQ